MPPVCFRSAKMRPNSVVTSRVISVWIASAFFFLRCQCILDRPRRADLFADLNDLCTEFLKPMKFRHLHLCLAQRRRRRKCLGDRFAFHPACQAEVGAMATGTGFRAMAVGFTALARSTADRAAAKVAEGGQLAEQVGSFGLQLRQ